jgi:hypothetical protein
VKNANQIIHTLDSCVHFHTPSQYVWTYVRVQVLVQVLGVQPSASSSICLCRSYIQIFPGLYYIHLWLQYICIWTVDRSAPGYKCKCTHTCRQTRKAGALAIISSLITPTSIINFMIFGTWSNTYGIDLSLVEGSFCSCSWLSVHFSWFYCTT